MRTFRTAILIAITSSACARSASRDHTAPSAQFIAYPTTGPAQLRVRFDATSSHDDVGVVSFQWDFGDGYSARGAVVDHTFPSRGAFLAALIASDAAERRHVGSRAAADPLRCQVLPGDVPNDDGFGVYYPQDGATLDVLAKWAR